MGCSLVVRLPVPGGISSGLVSRPVRRTARGRIRHVLLVLAAFVSTLHSIGFVCRTSSRIAACLPGGRVRGEPSLCSGTKHSKLRCFTGWAGLPEALKTAHPVANVAHHPCSLLLVLWVMGTAFWRSVLHNAAAPAGLTPCPWPRLLVHMHSVFCSGGVRCVPILNSCAIVASALDSTTYGKKKNSPHPEQLTWLAWVMGISSDVNW